MVALQIFSAVLLVALLAVLIALPAAACCGHWSDKPAGQRGLHWREWHHGYLGAIALFPVPTWLQVIAILVLLDDLVLNHMRQLWGDDPFAKSPLKILAERTWYAGKQKLGLQP